MWGLRPTSRPSFPGRVPGRPVAPVPAGINAAFDSFSQDYTQARGVYLSALATPGSSDSVNMGLRAAFVNYTQNRVELLGQQLTGLFVHASAGAQSQHSNQSQGAGTNLYRVVQTRVSGLETTGASTPTLSNNVFRLGTVGRALIDSTPTSNVSPGTTALDSLAQDQAIEAARVAVTNGFAFNKTLNSGHNSKK